MIFKTKSKATFKKGSLQDILWFVVIFSTFIIILMSQLQFSTVSTIDTYAKDLINSEVSKMVSNIPGFSTKENQTNMYSISNSTQKRPYGSGNATGTSEMATSLNDPTASATGIVQRAVGEMNVRIINAFGGTYSIPGNTVIVDDFSTSYKALKEKTFSRNNPNLKLSKDDIKVSFKESSTGKSTHITVEVLYHVNIGMYGSKKGGYVEGVQNGVNIPRKVTVTRTIQNISRFR